MYQPEPGRHMDDILEHRLIRILRDSPLPSVAVRDLHTALVAEAGPAIGSASRLMEELRSHGDVFFLLEPENPLGDAACWPPDLRAQYERQLEAAGIVAGPRVALAPRGRTGSATFIREVGPTGHGLGDSPPDPLRDSLVEIWEASAHRPDLRRAVATALLNVPPAREHAETDSGPAG
jgi:hypothetical protein